MTAEPAGNGLASTAVTPPERVTRLRFLILAVGVAVCSVAVWLLRQPHNLEATRPWLLLSAASLVSAVALRVLGVDNLGRMVEVRPPSPSSRGGRLVGVALILLSWILTLIIVWRLWPDYQNRWHGLPIIWIGAMTFLAVGAFLIGSVGEGAARAVTGRTLWSQGTWSALLELVAFACILALGVFLRVHRLPDLPPGIYVDETDGALDALYMLEGRNVSPFANGWGESPNGYLYFMRLLFGAFGPTWATLKLASLIPAILTLPAVYFLGRHAFGPLAGFTSMALLAVSRWHFSFSRWGWKETAPPLLQVLSTFLLLRGLRDRRATDYAAGGLMMGLGLYTYTSSRLAVATTVAFIVLWFVTDPAGPARSIRLNWQGGLLFLAAAVVAAAPLLVTYVTDPPAWNTRVSEISIVRDIQSAGSWGPLIHNLSDAARFFHQVGDHHGRMNLPHEPMADPFTGVLLAIGLGGLLLSLRDHRSTLLLLWLTVGLSGSFLSSRAESPQSYRALTALPAVVLIAGRALSQLALALHQGLRGPRPDLLRSRASLMVAAGVLLAVPSGAALWEFDIYFNKQAVSSVVLGSFNPVETAAGRDATGALEAGKSVYLEPHIAGPSVVRFLVYASQKARFGMNTLEDPPYEIIVPPADLPLLPDGKDAVLLVDRQLWAVRDYFTYLYPEARLKLVAQMDGSPLYVRIEVPATQLAARQGVTMRTIFSDGHLEERWSAQIEAADDSGTRGTEWLGGVRIPRSGLYDFTTSNGMQVFLDDRQWTGPHYLGRGLYALRVVQPAGNPSGSALVWVAGEAEAAVAVPPDVLVNMSGYENGLLGTYWENETWEGEALFEQITPFIHLSWPSSVGAMPTERFSARFAGRLLVEVPGLYTLRVDADDGARLTLDGQVLGDGLEVGQPNSFEAVVFLEVGAHPVQIDYVQNGGSSALNLLWRYEDTEMVLVPPRNLSPR